MLGLMQQHDMVISSLIEYAAKYHSQQQVVTRLSNNTYHTTTYAAINKRAKSIANSLLQQYNIKLGDIIGTIAFNCYRHIELYYGVSGIGAVLHTINPRLHIEQIEYMITQTENKLIFVDINCINVVYQLTQRNNIPCTQFVVMCSIDSMDHTMKQHNMQCYEMLINNHSSELQWPTFNENTASSLCYTSGTTGNAKGVLYSHRSAILHSYRICMRDHMGIYSGDTILCIAPLFHSNAWSIPYAACMTGAKLVFPGRVLDGATICDLLVSQRITFTFGVPTIWQMLFAYLDANKYIVIQDLNRIVIGGSACPISMIERFQSMNVQVLQLWGMTELSPLGTIGTLLPQHTTLSNVEKAKIMSKQGRVSYGIDIELVDDNNHILPNNGVTTGSIVVRGPCVTKAYFKCGVNNQPVDVGSEASVLNCNGYLNTGDIGTIDSDGYLTVVDRCKDLIKSGGEWISSVELENIALSYSGIYQAAVISAYHSKWFERPLMLVVLKPDTTIDTKALLKYIKSKVASYCAPDAVEIVTSLPLTATGKIQKHELRKMYTDYRFANDMLTVAG